MTTPGSATKQPAESVDIYPTLAELADLQPPSGPQPINGVSLVPVLMDPAVRVRDHAYHAYPRKKLGRAIRTERYRLVEWRSLDRPKDKAEYELYDYESDPLERKNLAADQPNVLRKLKQTLGTYPAPVASSRNRRRSVTPSI